VCGARGVYSPVGPSAWVGGSSPAGPGAREGAGAGEGGCDGRPLAGWGGREGSPWGDAAGGCGVVFFLIRCCLLLLFCAFLAS